MNVVIVGAGHAAAQLISALHMQGQNNKIVLIGQESHLPYQRPFLSKQLLAGEVSIKKVFLNGGSNFYDKVGVEVMLNTRVETIDRNTRTLILSNNKRVSYEYLALTTGARARRLHLPGVELEDIFYLRNIGDALAIRERFRSGARLVVIGGGYIGLEVAAVAKAVGLKVTVVESENRVMSRVVAPEISAFYEELHRQNGVDVRTGTKVTGFDGNGKVSQVVTDGGSVPCDLVVVGVGIAPDTAIAVAANLHVDHGVVVDEYAQTTDAHIVAAGDCTNHPNSIYGRRLRLECVQNAVDQSITAAKTICGKCEPYSSVPWFWSDQYDVKLQISGLSQGYDETVLRGNPVSREFSVFYLRGGVIIAVDAVNSPHEYMMGKRLIAARSAPPPGRIADSSVPVRSLMSY